MGQCGCGDTRIDYVLPKSADGFVYAMQMQPGCPECGYGPGVIIYRMDAQSAADWGADEAPALPMYSYSDDGEGDGHAFFEVLSINRLAKALAVDDPEDFEVNPEVVCEVAGETIQSEFTAHAKAMERAAARAGLRARSEGE